MKRFDFCREGAASTPLRFGLPPRHF
jgi:hypothetical protein